METDAVVGRLLDALEKSGHANNTLVFFTSDNGFAAYAGAKDLEARGHFPSGPLRGYKTDVHEGGHREPYIIRWPSVVEPDSVCGQLVLQADFIASPSHEGSLDSESQATDRPSLPFTMLRNGHGNRGIA